MGLTIKVLANDRLSTTLTTGTTVPIYMPAADAPAKVAIVKVWRFTNITSGSVKVNAYFQKNVGSGGTFNSSNARRILAIDFIIEPGYCTVDDIELTLGAGDGIFAKCDTANAVDIVISGVEEDVSSS